MSQTPSGCCAVLQGSERVFWTYSIASLLLSPRAKTAEHLLGVFAFGPDRQGAIANGPAWAAPEKHRPPLHPWQSRPALIERLVKPLVLRWKTRPAVKVNQSLKGTWS